MIVILVNCGFMASNIEVPNSEYVHFRVSVHDSVSRFSSIHLSVTLVCCVTRLPGVIWQQYASQGTNFSWWKISHDTT